MSKKIKNLNNKIKRILNTTCYKGMPVKAYIRYICFLVVIIVAFVFITLCIFKYLIYLLDRSTLSESDNCKEIYQILRNDLKASFGLLQLLGWYFPAFIVFLPINYSDTIEDKKRKLFSMLTITWTYTISLFAIINQFYGIMYPLKVGDQFFFGVSYEGFVVSIIIFIIAISISFNCIIRYSFRQIDEWCINYLKKLLNSFKYSTNSKMKLVNKEDSAEKNDNIIE